MIRSCPSLAPAFLLAALAACGGGDEIIPPAIDGSSSVDAPPSIDGPGPAMPTALAASGDFGTTGVLSRLDVAAAAVTPNVLAMVAGGDPYLRRIGDEILIVNRDMGENVTILRRSPLALVDQFATGGGSNPQDVAIVGNKLYVPAYGTAGVIVIDRTTRATSTISLASLDPDGKPDCVSAYAVGTRVYVACGLLTNFAATGPGKMVVIDTADNDAVTSFDLPERNPIGLIQPSPAGSMFGGDLLVPTIPSFSSFTTGCLARVRTTGTPGANGCAVTNLALEGYVNHVDVTPEGDRAWLAVSAFSADFTTETGRLRSLDLATGQLGAVISAPTSKIVDVASCAGGYVVASERATGMTGVRIFKDGVETTAAPLNIGRPPSPGNGLICY